MLFRVVRPMKREGSRFQVYVRRIPVDVRDKLAGRTLHFPLGDTTRAVTISPRAQAIRFSLRTDDPAEVKARNGAADQYLERILRAFRDDTATSLTNSQATALAGRLYRAWAGGEGRERTTAVEQGPDKKMRPVPHDPGDDAAHLEAALQRLVRLGSIGKHEMDRPPEKRKPYDLDHPPRPDEEPDGATLEIHLGPLVERLLLAEGIRRVEAASRGLLLRAFWLALRDALEARLRNAQGDYSPDPKSERFPAWTSPVEPASAAKIEGGSLTELVEDWWKEAKAAGRKPSTYESYRNTMAKLVGVLKHDDVSRVTPQDIVRFKDVRIENGVSPKTVKDSDLAGLKTIFGWAVMNRRMSINPAEGLTIKTSKPRKLRAKGFSDKEAMLILKHARTYKAGGEAPKLAAAKRWVPWLCAFTGARVGEMLQLRKQDVRREGKHWIVHVTPEAGPVKTDEARDVVLHRQIVESGFLDFVQASSGGHLFVSPSADELGVRKAVKTARNKVNTFVREVVADPHVDPSHGWRHRFKTVGIDEGVEIRVLDSIQGHAPRNISEGYGEVTIKAKANAIAKFPDIKV